MAKPEWGAKRICPSCGARYYDLHRDPIICPKCGTQYDPEALLKTRRRPAAAAPEPVPVPVAGSYSWMVSSRPPVARTTGMVP